MDIDTPPNPEISLQTVLDAVNRQSQEIEAKVDAKISEKIGHLRDEIHGTNQCMKSQLEKMKSDSQYKLRSEGNIIQFNGNNKNLENLTQALWALDNSETDYARDLIMGFTYPIPDRWRMCTISYSIPRWRTAISCGQCRRSNMIHYAEMHRQTFEKLT